MKNWRRCILAVEMYCPYCGCPNITPVYAANGVTLRYYRCAPVPEGCGRIILHPIIIDPDAVKQNENA